MTIGIYLLEFKGTDKVYIGQSLSIEARYSKHLLRLKNNLGNYKMQNAYNLYGNPTLKILCSCSEEELNDLEEEAFQIYDAINNGLNIRDKAVGGRGARGEEHSMSKYSNNEIEEVFLLLINNIDKPFSWIENTTEVSLNTIRDISKGKTHLWLKDKYPTEYEYLISLKNTRVVNTSKNKELNYPTILSPEGKEYTIDNISQFARDYKLNKSHLRGVLAGLRKTHLGWKLKR